MSIEQTASAPAGGAEDLSRLVQAAGEALTDSMVERLSETSANALELLDSINRTETREALLHLLDRLTELHASGALDTLLDTVTLMHGMRNALTDSMVERLFGYAERTINNLGSDDVACLVENACNSFREAAEETAAAPASSGLLAGISLLGKPETQRTMRFLVAFGDKMQAAADVRPTD